MKFDGGINMNNKFYMPVMKSKHGEFLALSKLRDPVKKNVIPLLEVTPLEWSAEGKKPKTIEDHLDLFCKRYAQNWNTNCCFIDTVLMKHKENDDTHRIEYIFNRLFEKSVCPIPVLHVHNSNSFVAAISGIKGKYGIQEFGLRIIPDELTSPEIESEINSILEKIGITANACHLI
ncbi:MAG TPA: hypothetical protein VG870_03900, partial [Chitinophagaceae bacterium]|nr:hypothetical protein [Chitinophagaceae bacterium]